MSDAVRTPAGEAVTDLVLDLFRVSSRMTTAGDRLVAGLGLTSARWQILGTMMAADRPQPVAWLARDMAASRQNLQRIINDLARDGLVDFRPNPHHRRAPLVAITDKGRLAFSAAMALQAPWVNGLAKDLSMADIAAAQRVMAGLRLRLEATDDQAV
jgi:DNA-binding MarR family transcriptional regulator